MIFQNFGFNKPIIQAAGSSGPNYVSGAKLIYDFGNASSYSGSGASVYDVSGNAGATATLYNSPTFSSLNGGYMSFNKASNQRLAYSGYFSSQFTIQLYWRLTSGVTPAYPGLAGQANNNGAILAIDTGWPGNDGVYAIIYSGAGGNTSSGAILDAGTSVDITNKFALFTLTYAPGDINYYVNTSLAAHSTATYDRTSYTPTNQTVEIAVDNSNGTYCSGDCMAWLVYDRALTSTEITQNYNIFSAR